MLRWGALPFFRSCARTRPIGERPRPPPSSSPTALGCPAALHRRAGHRRARPPTKETVTTEPNDLTTAAAGKPNAGYRKRKQATVARRTSVTLSTDDLARLDRLMAAFRERTGRAVSIGIVFALGLEAQLGTVAFAATLAL